MCAAINTPPQNNQSPPSDRHKTIDAGSTALQLKETPIFLSCVAPQDTKEQQVLPGKVVV